MIARNMNNIENNVKSLVANIWVMKDTKEDTRGYTKQRSWQDPESKRSLPSFRPSLASYALEYGGALRMIRVSIFLTDLTRVWCLKGVAGASIYSCSIHFEPSDQTNLKARCICKPKGGGEPTFKGGGWQVGQGADRPSGALMAFFGVESFGTF
jgi:hypothetical protein